MMDGWPWILAQWLLVFWVILLSGWCGDVPGMSHSSGGLGGIGNTSLPHHCFGRNKKEGPSSRRERLSTSLFRTHYGCGMDFWDLDASVTFSENSFEVFREKESVFSLWVASILFSLHLCLEILSNCKSYEDFISFTWEGIMQMVRDK